MQIKSKNQKKKKMSLLETLCQAYPAFANQTIDLQSITVDQLIQSIDWNSIDASTICQTIPQDMENVNAYNFLDPNSLKNWQCENHLANMFDAPNAKITLGYSYNPMIDYSYGKPDMYKSLIRTFTSYFHVRQHIGHKSIILDDTRITLLIDKYNNAVSSLGIQNPNINITPNKVIKAYVVSFDTEFLGHKKNLDKTCMGVIKNICLENNTVVGTKYGKMLADISVEEYKIISDILDESDRAYYDHVQNENIQRMCLPTSTVFDDILLKDIEKKD